MNNATKEKKGCPERRYRSLWWRSGTKKPLPEVAFGKKCGCGKSISQNKQNCLACS